jgi:ABC-2 type transport system ATP-binding protein
VHAPPIIQIHALNKVYRQRNGDPIQAVRDLNLSVPRGQVFGFLGPNGAGKTTTIKMMCCLVRPTSGSVKVGGHDVWRVRGAALRQIGAVLEGARNVYWPLSAWDNLVYFGHLKGLTGKVLIESVERLLRELDLWNWRNDLVRTFSRGMQQKVAIACALVADPPVVLLDEPTLGLDVRAARLVRDLVVRLAREEGKTIVLTTHQLGLAEELCERVAIINKGRVIADRPVEELLGLFRDEYYRIKVEGRLPPGVVSHMQGLTIHEENDHTVLSGPVADQDSLYNILLQLCDHNLPLLSIQQVEPDLEQVFVQLLDAGEDEE